MKEGQLMNPYLYIFVLLLLSGTAVGQNAQQVLQQLQQSYPSDQYLHVSFTLSYHSPDGNEQTMQGKAWRKSDQYRVELPDQWILSNGETRWNFLRDIDEIHIEDASSTEGDLNPVNFMSYYQKAGFIPGITLDKQTKDGRLQHISFKPEGKDSEIVKARIELLDGTPFKVYARYRNGMKTVVDIEDIHLVDQPDTSMFQLDVSDYPDAYVEDLRTD